MAKQRAFITGITGMVGSHLADFLLENTDWDIYGMCRWRSPLDNIAHLIPQINQGKRIHLQIYVTPPLLIMSSSKCNQIMFSI
jgi:GDP-D-mannose dehydratase